MKKLIAALLIIGGLSFGGFSGYTWVTEASSGSETLGEQDIVVTEEVSQNNSSNEFTNEPIQEDTLLPQDKSPETAESEPRAYAEYERGDDIGWLLIPALDIKYPIYWGTDDQTLTQGVGYHDGDFTTPPDSLGHTVLSGHRDTVFRELGELKEAEAMYIQFEDVQYKYEINKTWITDADDRSVIVSKDEPTLTLTTCYPFNFIGPAPDRYIIEASLVETTDM